MGIPNMQASNGQQHISPKKCWISILPDETLSQIFSYIYIPDNFYGFGEVSGPVTLVCRRWRRITEFWLFHILKFYEPSTETRLQKLQLLFKTRPHLASITRTIHLCIRKPQQCTVHAVVELLKCCVQLRELHLSSQYTIDTLPIIQAIDGCPHLEHLVLQGSGFRADPSIQLILRYFTTLSLKSMSISEYGVGGHDDELQVGYNPAEIEIRYQLAGAHVAEHLLRWPAGLISLSILNFGMYKGEPPGYATKSLQKMLELHRHSLKNIQLGLYEPKDYSMLDFSGFSHLETLTMSSLNIMGREVPSNAVRKLNAPNLRHLTLDYGFIYTFGRNCAMWMQNFASLKYTHCPQSKLRDMLITFEPSQDLFEDSGIAHKPIVYNGIWPWHHIEKTAEFVAQYGITIQYAPGWTKEDQDKEVKAAFYLYIEPGTLEHYDPEAELDDDYVVFDI
ncbi:hypothetical protein F5884DRAFT_865362 [Xylogone sp. PMI_703]|nr:hypothetical protein F5884DRAFT_865362 [Xylogone sp. PMI_703]